MELYFASRRLGLLVKHNTRKKATLPCSFWNVLFLLLWKVDQLADKKVGHNLDEATFHGFRQYSKFKRDTANSEELQYKIISIEVVARFDW